MLLLSSLLISCALANHHQFIGSVYFDVKNNIVLSHSPSNMLILPEQVKGAVKIWADPRKMTVYKENDMLNNGIVFHLNNVLKATKQTSVSVEFKNCSSPPLLILAKVKANSDVDEKKLKLEMTSAIEAAIKEVKQNSSQGGLYQRAIELKEALKTYNSIVILIRNTMDLYPYSRKHKKFKSSAKKMELGAIGTILYMEADHTKRPAPMSWHVRVKKGYRAAFIPLQGALKDLKWLEGETIASVAKEALFMVLLLGKPKQEINKLDLLNKIEAVRSAYLGDLETYPNKAGETLSEAMGNLALLLGNHFVKFKVAIIRNRDDPSCQSPFWSLTQ